MNQMAPEPTGCRCGQPTRDHAYVCEDCLDQLARELGEIPWRVDQLETTLTGAKGVNYQTKGGAKAAETALPVNLGAADAARELHAILRDWVKYCRDEGVRHSSPQERLPAEDPAAMSRWLLWRVDGLAFTELGAAAVSEVHAISTKIDSVIDRPADKWFAGMCDNCGSSLYVPPKAAVAKCKAILGGEEPCGQEHDVAARRETLLAEAEDRLANATDVARAVSWLGAMPLTAARVWKWAERGRIIAKGHDGKHPLYRIGDAIDLLAASSKTG